MKSIVSLDLKEFINFYKLSKDDVLLLSELYHQRIPYEKKLFSGELRRITKEINQIESKYNLSFLAKGHISILFKNSPLITNSNYDLIVASDNKATVDQKLESVEEELELRKNVIPEAPVEDATEKVYAESVSETNVLTNTQALDYCEPGDAEIILKIVGKNKLAVAKLIIDSTGVSLVDAKAAMDSVPISLAVDIDREYAESLAVLFEDNGAEIEIRSKAQREELEFLPITNKRIDAVDTALKKISDLEIPSITEYKSNVVEYEDVISKKSGDSQLFSFLKVDSFLQDFRNRIRLDQSELSNGIDVERIKNEAQKRKQNKGDKQNLMDAIATFEGRKESTFDFKLEKVLTLGENMTASMEAQITTLEFYHSMANAMLIYYLEDRKIRYFELYEAFEKMGVFDSTWEKNVLLKLESIDIRLATIGGKMIELNRNFKALADASGNIVSELQSINNSLITNNVLTAITAYQTWRINRNTKYLE